jgi:hypothetical protein
LKIAVIGTGSGGILTLCHMIYFLRQQHAEITSIYDPSVPSIGIGESTNPFFWDSNCLALNINDREQFIKNKELDSTKKRGTLYKNWREEDFLNPLMFVDEDDGQFAVHFNTHKYKEFAFDRLHKIWGNRFKELKGSVSDIKNKLNEITVTVDDTDYIFDYVIDCRGFPKSFEGYNVLEMPLNHALVHNKTDVHEDWNYTLHQATENGWMFSVPLATRTSYGYLFNDKITSVEDAKNNFSKTIGVPVDQLQGVEHKFKNYYIEKIIDGRLFKNGNSAMFFEPMFANSLLMYDFINKLFVEKILNRNASEAELNFIFQQQALEVHDLICFYYHGGSIFKTDFWNYAVEYASTRLKDSTMFKKLCDKFAYMNKNNCTINSDTVFSSRTLKKVDKAFGYYYWNTKE